MNSAVMRGTHAPMSPRSKARIAGAFYLLTIAMGVASVALRGSLIVSSDATATTVNILAHETPYRLSFVADFIGMLCYIVVTALFYEMFKPVNRSISRVAAFISLVGCAVGAVSLLFELAPFLFLSDAPYLRVFSLGQLQALAFAFFKLGGQTNNIGLVLFGFYCLLIGYLILRSTFLPRAVGVLMMIAGVGWLTFLHPPLSKVLFPYSVAPGLIGELSLTLWLLVKGVDAPRWTEQAKSAA